MLVSSTYSTSGLIPALQEITQSLAEAMEVAESSIWTFTHNGGLLECLVHFDATRETFIQKEALDSERYPAYFEALRKGSSVDAKDALHDPRTCDLFASRSREQDIRSLLDTGILIEGNLIGVVCLGHRGYLRDWDGDEMSFVSRTSAVVGQLLSRHELRRATEELKASEQRFRQLFEFTPAISVQGYNSSREVIFWNSASESLYGYSRDQALGKKLEDLIIPEAMRQGVIDAIDQWVHHGTPIQAEALTLKKADGSPCPVYSNHVLLQNRAGEVELYCLDIDLSSLKHTQDELAQVNRQLRTIVDLVPNYIFVKDAQGRFLFCNKAFADIFKTDPDSVVGKTDQEFGVKEEHIRLYLKADQTVIQSGEPLLVEEERILKADGKEGWFQTVKVPFQHPHSSVPGVLAVSTDITSRKETENQLMDLNHQREIAVQTAHELALQAQSANLVKTEFLANLSHELRTPMNGVLGIAEMLLDLDLTEEQIDFVRAIRESGNRMMELVSQLLQLSDIDTGRSSIKREPVNLRTFLEKEVAGLEALCRKKHLKCCHELDETTPDFIFADALLLHRILWNLENNAVKFTESGEVRFEVAFIESTRPTLHFKLLDSGPGIQEASKERIFEPFFQQDSTLTRAHEGLGLGLTVAKHLVHLMEGEIGCENRPEGGSRFWVSLPCDVCADADSRHPESRVPATAKRATTPGASPSKTGIILIVEDDALNRNLAVGMVQKLGYQTQSAENGRRAVEMLSTQRFDAVLMDVRMPELDGLAATRQLRESRNFATASNTPVIAITAQAYDSDKDDCMSAGMNDYLSKPFSIHQIQDMLHTWIPSH